MKSTKELLQHKRDGGTWSGDEVRHFITGVVSGAVSHVQAAAFLMAACTRGLTPEEVAALTVAMADSGERIATGLSPRPYIDKHSSGGVGDKVSLLLAPLAACCGLAVPMISGRGLGHTGGTVDKLESVPGLRMNMSIPELEHLLTNHHLFMSAQNPSLAPADKLLYALRDVTGTVENVGLLTASILSKKFAEGLDGLVMDVKVGRGAFMKHLAEAEDLGRSIQNVSKQVELPTHILFSRMERPTGKACGNWVEVAEAEESLRDRSMCSSDLLEITLELTAHMVMLGSSEMSRSEAHRIVLDAWDTGAAHNEFMHMLERQGGDFAQGVAAFDACVRTDVVSTTEGYVSDVDAMNYALGILYAGGGRKKETDIIDPFVGIIQHVALGDKVLPGTVLATVSATTRASLEPLTNAVQTGIHITTTAPVEPEPSMIIQRWT